MKKQLITIALIIAGITPLSTAANNEPESKPEQILQNALCLTPSVTDKIEVLFTTDEYGCVDFVLAKTANPLLKKKIESSFYSLHFTGLKKDAVNSITINFKSI